MAAKTSRIDQKARGVVPTPASLKRWHAVAIRPMGSSCAAAQVCRTARYLSREAPRLPLADCTKPDTCACVYKHLADRRGPPRRQDEQDGLRRNSKVEQERRQTGDRRKND
jgi:hypothetical protein